MDNIDIVFNHHDQDAPEEMVNQLPCCPVCGAKAFLHGDAPDGCWFGWSIGCPRYCLDDGIHGHDSNTPRKEHLMRTGFATKKSAVAWWKKRVKKEQQRQEGKDGDNNDLLFRDYKPRQYEDLSV